MFVVRNARNAEIVLVREKLIGFQQMRQVDLEGEVEAWREGRTSVYRKVRINGVTLS